MINVRYAVLIVTCLLGIWPPPGRAAPNDPGGDPWAKQRELFRVAWDAVNKKRYKDVQNLQEKLKTYPLYPYLQFAYLSKTLPLRNDKDIERFMQASAGTPLRERMRVTWLNELARREKWTSFLKVYRPTDSAELRCQYAFALFQAGKTEQAARIAKTLWEVGTMQPEACVNTFSAYRASGRLSQASVWSRAVMAMRENHPDLARHVMDLLQEDQDRYWLLRWLEAHERPQRVFEQDLYRQDTELTRAIVMHAVKRISFDDVGRAWQLWQEVSGRYRYTDAEVEATREYVALRAVYHGADTALDWLAQIKSPKENAAQWRIRLALREQQWPRVRDWILALPAEQRAQEKWRYWYARALQEMGKQQSDQAMLKQAVAVFEKLAENRSYFGFLAADHVGSAYALKMQSARYDERELDRVRHDAGIVRARELFLLDMWSDARREWHYSTRHFNAWDLKLAAALASEWGWYDRAIHTYARTTAAARSKVDIVYPMGYRNTVLEQARRQKIDPAWIYGVVRQESAFVTDARSHAGAVGLMQLLPSTARLVSRLTSTPLRKAQELLRPETNIQLGSAYLRMLLDKNDGNAVLATASYNAGNRRIQSWLPAASLPADIWVESIPFTETRHYVGQVLAYTVIFDHLLDGKTERLRDRMPDIGPVAQN